MFKMITQMTKLLKLLIFIAAFFLPLSSVCFAAVEFDGIDDYISLGNSSEFNSVPFSISLWIKPNNPAS
jgi:hypothetical protein